MEYSKTYRLKGSVCELDKFIDFCKWVSDIANSEKNNTRPVTFQIEREDGITLTKRYPNEMKKAILETKHIKEITVDYWGQKSRVRIRSYVWPSDIQVDIASEKEALFLLIEKKINDIFQEKTWNSYSTILFYSSYIILSISIATILILRKVISIDVFRILPLILLFPAFWLETIFTKHYPGLVIIRNEKPSGRILKNDFWFIILTLGVPFVLNKL